MRRVATVTVLSGAMAAGLFAAGPAALAQSKPSADQFGKEVTITGEGAISKKDLIAEANLAGKPYTAKETAAITAASKCRYYERTRGRTSKGRWLIKVTNRLTWCWNGSSVLSYRANFKAYTYNKNVWRWRGWAKKSAVHPKNWSYVTATAQGAFYYTGNHKTYKPYVIIQGDRHGTARWKTGG